LRGCGGNNERAWQVGGSCMNNTSTFWYHGGRGVVSGEDTFKSTSNMQASTSI